VCVCVTIDPVEESKLASMRNSVLTECVYGVNTLLHTASPVKRNQRNVISGEYVRV
jgi:hypothetical protein